MTIQNRIAASLMAAALFSGAAFAQNQNQTQTTSAPTTTTQDWNTPPAGTEQSQQQGYRDGIEAAKLDKLAHRPIDPKVSHLYVHPPVKGQAVATYRTGFEGGYKAALNNGGM